ncbi:MAG: potassium channel family protein [Halobacteriota archaeon]
MPKRSERVESTSIEYEPISVKDLLVETKDTSELLIDLAYSAVLHHSKEVGREVLELERAMDVLQMRARMSLLLAARNPDEAEQLAPVLGMVAGAEKISDAAGDIAKVVLDDMGLPQAMRTALPEAVESVVRGTIEPTAGAVDRTLGDVDLESATGVRVIAIRRGASWILNPGQETYLRGEDVVILRGPSVALEEVYEELTGVAFEPPVVVERPSVPDLDRAVDSIVLMKDLSELAVDLAYSSVLFDNAELAEEVHHIEVEVDALRARFEAWTLQAAAQLDDPVQLRGLLQLGFATETISDAAIEISEGILRDIDVHPVTQLAVQESDELMVRIEVDPGSDLEGSDVSEGVPDHLPAISVLAVRRPEEGCLLMADGSTTLRAGDVVIGKGTASVVEAFEAASTA